MKKGWEIKKLIELGEIQTGTTPSTRNKEFYGDYIPFVKPPHFISDGTINYENEGLSETGLNKGRLIKENSILMVCIGATIGKTGITTIPVSCNQQINAFTPKKELEPRYFYYLLNSSIFFNEVLKLSSQATLPMINKSKWQGIKVSYPKSLTEQKRIVSILDRAFEAIDKAKANAEQNLKNAKELFEGYLQGVFSNGQLKIENGEWVEKKLNEITEVKDGTHDSPKYIKEGIPFVTQKNIKPNGFTIENTKFITENDHHKFYKRSNVTFGDILISMIGANRGMSAIVNIKDTFSIKNVGLIKESKNINQFFLLYYLQSSLAIKYVKYMSNGGAQEFVGLRALRAFPIPFPKSIEEQRQIVENLDVLSAETQKLKTIYQQKIDDLKELKKSVLQKAFNGQLSEL